MAELGIYVLSSLLGAGYFLSQNKEKRDEDDTAKLPHNDSVVGSDIYNSRDYFKHKEREFQAVSCNWEASKQPELTNIIPMYYNTLHVKDDYEKIPNANYDSNLVLKSVKYLKDDREFQGKLKAAVIHDSARNVQPEWGIVMDRSVQTRGDPEDPLKKIGGSLVPGQSDFTHNNMVPFYGRDITQDTREHSQGKDMKLEIYTGQFKLNRGQKEAVEPHFVPMAENIYGTQITRDLSRFNPNNTGKKHGETPMEKITVGPGLGQGFTNLPSGGKHETLRIMPKTKEQLRVDPVMETEAKSTIGGSQISKRSLISQVYRNRPELLVENKAGERNFTTVGAVTAPASQPTIILRDTNRKESREVRGSAKSVIDAPLIAPKSKKSRKVNFLHTSFRNNYVKDHKSNDYGRSGYVAYDNNRMSLNKSPKQSGGSPDEKGEWGGTQTQTHILGVAGPQASKERIRDHARKTRKQHYIKNPRQLGNSLFGQAKAPSYNPLEWIMKKTVKETTEDFNHLGTSKVIGAGAQPAKGKEWIMKKTVKETTEDFNHLGTSKVIGAGAQPAKGEEWIMKKTIKETTEDFNHTGNASIPVKKHIAWNPNDRARKTIRETTEDSNHIGNVKTSSVNKGGAYATTKWTANNTNRQFTSDHAYTGSALASGKKTISYDDAYNARLNENKEKVSKGRKPSERGPSLGHQNISIEHKKLDSDRQNKYVAVKTSTTGNVFNPKAISRATNTSEKNYLPQDDTRLDVNILDAFKNNPLTQSLASWF